MKKIKVPEITDAEIAFGSITHLPKWSVIPDEFKEHDGNFWTKFISSWFFGSAFAKEKLPFVKAKNGIDDKKAMRAITAILKSYEPKHEHKEAGAAYLMSQWFDYTEKKE